MERDWKERLRELLEEFMAHNEGRIREVYLFGSRAWGKPWRGSDFDLAVEGDRKTLGRLKEFLEESTFPFEVDVVPLSEVEEPLKQKILEKGEKWI